MSENTNLKSKPVVAVFGAAGHTGRFVLAELLRRGIRPIAIARDLATLTAMNRRDAAVLYRQASVVEMPLSEVILIGRHLKTSELHTYLSSNALRDIRDPATPAPTAADATGRSSQRFVVDAVVRRDGKSRRMTAQGRDIHAFTAPLVCEATEPPLKDEFSSPGVHPPGAIFDAREVLSALTPDPLTFEITAA